MPLSSGATSPIRGPQSFFGGLCLLAVGAFALWAMSDLASGTLRAMGPGLLPRWLAYGAIACGVALLVASLTRPGEPVEASTWRGPVFVCLAIAAFALTIRPFPLGPVSTPGLGLALAGPLCVLVGGYATPEARWRELLVLGLGLTAFSMLLFGDLLNLPIPMFPQEIAALFPEGWSQKNMLRVLAGLETVAAIGLYLTGRGSSEPARIDVAQHSIRA